MNTIALDFESLYSKEIGINVQGVWHYLRHPAMDIYMVSVVGIGADSKPISFVGAPKDFDWRSINGCRWVAHNYAFDGAVIERLRELSVIPADVQPGDWNCTANLAAWSDLPRNLAGACKEQFGADLSKDMRAWMKGKTWADAIEAGKADDMREYALRDSEWCLKLWETLSPSWPEKEQWLSKHTIQRGWEGIHVDVPLAEQYATWLKAVKFDAERQLPWFEPEAPVLSPIKLAKACRELGIEPPLSMAEDDEGCEQWELEHGDRIPFIRHMRRWRKANTLLKKLQVMLNRVRPDGTFGFGLKYCGTKASNRWAGESGFNLQNLPREPFTDESFDGEVDLRRCLIPPPGRVWLIPDLSNIEPRILAWLSGNGDFLKGVAKSSPYQVHAELYMGWKGGNLKKKDPKKYSLSKARTLALGFQAGWNKFIVMIRSLGMNPYDFLSDPVTSTQVESFLAYLKMCRKTAEINTFRDLKEEDQRLWVNSYLQVADFRMNNPLLSAERTGLWDKLDKMFKRCLKGNFSIELPNGKTLTWYDVSDQGGYSARTIRGDRRQKMYGGYFTNQITQGTAREVFAECIRRVEDAGYRVVWTVHDELVIDAALDDKVEDIEALMAVTPDWLEGCPIASEIDRSFYYKK